MKRSILFTLLLFFSVIFLSAQNYSPAYTQAMETGNKFFSQGRYQEARTYYVKAREVKNGGNPSEAQRKVEACDAKIKAQRDAAEAKRRAEEEEAAKTAKIKAEEKAKEEAKAAEIERNKRPEIKFEKVTYDFGVIQEENGKVTGRFIFTNEGTKDLILTSVRPACGCTAVNYVKNPVAPGQTGYIDVTYNPANRPGTFNKNVRVYTNEPEMSGENPTPHYIFIKGTVVGLKQESEESKEPPAYFMEEMPEFPGGPQAMNAFLAKAIHYPENARNMGVKGTILVEFVVEKDGSITNAKVKVPLQPDCDKEAVRAVLSMPKWKPGKNGGKPVRAYYTVPVTFSL